MLCQDCLKMMFSKVRKVPPVIQFSEDDLFLCIAEICSCDDCAKLIQAIAAVAGLEIPLYRLPIQRVVILMDSVEQK